MKKDTSRPNKVEAEDPFLFFKKTVMDEFSFLIADFGFEHISTTVMIPECSILYRNETTSIRVLYEWGGVPWVQVSKVNRKGKQISEINEFGLGFLMMLRCPSLLNLRDYKYREAKEEDIRNIIHSSAESLREHGKDVLAGDFQIYGQIRPLASKNEKKINKAMFGSEDGETARSKT